MIFATFAETQVQRFSGLQFWAQREAEALDDLVEVLRVMADDDNEAEAVISHWLATERECPTPADLRACFADLREGNPNWKPPEPRPRACQRCRGLGYVISEEMRGLPGRETLVSIARKCGCRG
jgi:hypothetical protein